MNQRYADFGLTTTGNNKIRLKLVVVKRGWSSIRTPTTDPSKWSTVTASCICTHRSSLSKQSKSFVHLNKTSCTMCQAPSRRYNLKFIDNCYDNNNLDMHQNASCFLTQVDAMATATFCHDMGCHLHPRRGNRCCFAPSCFLLSSCSTQSYS